MCTLMIVLVSSTGMVTHNMYIGCVQIAIAFSITVTITADTGNAILGFLVQAWDPSDDRIGSFTLGVGMQWLNCSQFGIPAEVYFVHKDFGFYHSN